MKTGRVTLLPQPHVPLPAAAPTCKLYVAGSIEQKVSSPASESVTMRLEGQEDALWGYQRNCL